jgi:hypothetical protein
VRAIYFRPMSLKPMLFQYFFDAKSAFGKESNAFSSLLLLK